MWCWGDNSTGALGIPVDPVEPFSRFAVVPDLEVLFSTVAAGGGFSCGVDLDSTAVHCWGEAWKAAGPTAGEVTGLPPGPFKSQVAGTSHACVLMSDGTAYCWGGLKFAVISAEKEHTCGITVEPLQVDPLPADYRTSGAMFCWGYDGGNSGNNRLGRAFRGDDTSVPERVVEPPAAGA